MISTNLKVITNVSISSIDSKLIASDNCGSGGCGGGAACGGNCGSGGGSGCGGGR